MDQLTNEQRTAVEFPGSVLVTACPGSGKTRVLTYRVLRGIQELASSKHRVIAMTFTNRATDELESRLDRLGVETNQLWAGTIHSFALEWIIRPYAPYSGELRTGFTVVDEFVSEELLGTLRKEYGAKQFLDVCTAWTRNGQLREQHPLARQIVGEYKRRLREQKLLDYDDVLSYAYELVAKHEEIARTLGEILRLICIDEIQDTQDLQYGILSTIVRASTQAPTLFFVGDLDQSIYESLGSVPKSAAEIAQEFGFSTLPTLSLTGNYRSCQRVIDFYQHLRPQTQRIVALSSHRDERGIISYHNLSVGADDLPGLVAHFIQESIKGSTAPDDICVLAPQWHQVRSLGRSLVRLLPEVGFDAPGLSVFYSQRENTWFKLARLLLTEPNPRLYVSRLRWAGEFMRDLHALGIRLPEHLQTSRQILRLINSIKPDHDDGLTYLNHAFAEFVRSLAIDLPTFSTFHEAHSTFFAKARVRLAEADDTSATVMGFKRHFRHPSGVVIATCHAVKGEEYDTVIAVSLLRGYIPNWRVIIDGTDEDAHEQETKLLYVIASRAKKRLHMVSESGRFTQKRAPYEPSPALDSIRFAYDKIHRPII